MAFGDSDVSTMLADFGVSVVFNGTTVNGILDQHDNRDQMMAGQVDMVERIRVVTIKTDSLPGIVNESSVTVDGTSYKVRDILTEADGGLTQLFVVTP